MIAVNHLTKAFGKHVVLEDITERIEEDVYKRQGGVLPPAVIALLVIYCLRNIDLFSGSHGLPELLCVAVCALLHLWKRNELVSIFGSTALYMLLVQVVFP